MKTILLTLTIWAVLLPGVAFAPPLGPLGRAALEGWVAPEDDSMARIEALVIAKGLKYGVDADFGMANLEIESEFDHEARGERNSGAWGMAQLKSPTWDQYDCKGWPNQVAPAIDCMMRILADRIKACGSETAAIASYQKGTSGCPPIKESHALRVMDAKYKRILERG